MVAIFGESTYLRDADLTLYEILKDECGTRKAKRFDLNKVVYVRRPSERRQRSIMSAASSAAVSAEPKG